MGVILNGANILGHYRGDRERGAPGISGTSY